MSTKGPSIAPRQAGSPIAISPAASSPPSSGNYRTSSVSVPNGMTAASSAASKLEGNDSPGLTQIITSKEWVLPPRPKPGRKPSVDTPASKRKAQNRAAQRAFRERRATRVQELEQKLMEVEKEKEVKEMGLVNTINKLKLENQFLVKSLEQLKAEVASLKDSNSYVAVSPTSMGHVRPQFKAAYSMHNSPAVSAGAGSPASSSYSVQQISPAPSADSPPVYPLKHTHTHQQKMANFTPVSKTNTPAKDKNFDCGVCLKDDCLCESVGLKDATSEKEIDVQNLEETINLFKPMAAVSLPRKRKSTQTLEIDFTEKFSTKTKQMPDLKRLKKASTSDASLFNESSPVDNCGFCSDDTPCVCREAAKEAALLNSSLTDDSSRMNLNDEHHDDEQNKTLPPIVNNHNVRPSVLPVMHPGPSVEIREITNLTPGAMPTVVRRDTETRSSHVEGSSDNTPAPESSSTDVGCTGNPGTCKQCQMDPMSTLFCTTVANKPKEEELPTKSADLNVRESVESHSPSPQPGISRSGSRKLTSSLSNVMMPVTPSSSAPPPLIATNNPATSTLGMFIPCSDAYKTLSRHKKFNSVDFSTLVGKLTTRGMQVEVQSVANVLRELDRRLYN